MTERELVTPIEIPAGANVVTYADLSRARDRAQRELWVARREQVKIGLAYAFTAIIILSLALWGGIWLAVAAVSAWISPWL